MAILRTLAVLGILLLPYFGQSQNKMTPQNYLDSIYTLAQNTALLRDSVDWDSIKKKYYQLGKDAKSVSEIIPAVKYLLKSLNDFHGRIWVDRVPHNGLIKDFPPSDFEVPKGLVHGYRHGTIPFEGKLLGSNIGYLQVPSIQMSEADAENAKKIKSKICEIKTKHNPDGWILDLRLNGGGTMYPMLAGLSPFLGKDTVGYFMDFSDTYAAPWFFKNGELFIGDYQGTDYKIQLENCEDLDLKDAKVAVLIAAPTTSSGEITALAFQKRKNTLFIGENTGGYTTGVSWVPLSENVVIQITTSVYADRNKKTYNGTSVLPDIHIQGGQNFNDLESDKMIIEATKWIENKK